MAPTMARFRTRSLQEHHQRTVVLRQALFFAVPCALVSLGLKQLSKIEFVQQNAFLHEIAMFKVLNNAGAYNGFSLVLGFLVVFRTQMAYNRFWEGVSAAQRMSAEWFDSTSSILAFTKICKADHNLRVEFEKKFVKFLSLLHGVAVKSLRDLDDLQLDDQDLEGLTPESIKAIQESPYPTTVIFQWVQDIVVQAMEDNVLSVPAPILSRVFNELANGMVAYHDCLKIQATNIPIPYKQMTKILMGAHWFITPVVMCMWTDWETWTFIFTLVQSMIFWCLYFTANQIEYPFQAGDISYSVRVLHQEFNVNLTEIARTKTGQIESAVEGSDPTAWVHRITSFEPSSEEEGTLAVRPCAKSPRSTAQKSLIFDSETSVQIQIETPCRPHVHCGEICIENFGAAEHRVSESLDESKPTVQSEKQPNHEGPSPGIDKFTLSREEHSIQSRHQLSSTEITAGDRSSFTQIVAMSL